MKNPFKRRLFWLHIVTFFLLTIYPVYADHSSGEDQFGSDDCPIEITEIQKGWVDEAGNFNRQMDPDQPNRIFVDTKEDWNAPFKPNAPDKQRVKIKAMIPPESLTEFDGNLYAFWEVLDLDDPATNRQEIDKNGLLGADNTGTPHEREDHWLTVADHPQWNSNLQKNFPNKIRVGQFSSQFDEDGKTSTFLNFGDDGGDNYLIKVTCVFHNGTKPTGDDISGKSDVTDKITVWRIRSVRIFSMERRPAVDDVQVIRPSQGAPNEDCVGAGPNGIIDTDPEGDDEVNGNVINTGSDGICETEAMGDDRQLIPVGQGLPNQTCITAGPNNAIDLTPNDVQGDDVRDQPNQRIHTGPNGICETNANSFFPSQNGSASGTVQALRDGYANTEAPNHNCYIDWSINAIGLGTLDFEPVVNMDITGPGSLNQYIINQLHGGNATASHPDFIYDVIGMNRITGRGDLFGTASQRPHVAFAISSILSQQSAGDNDISYNIVHETGHAIAIMIRNLNTGNSSGVGLHDHHTDGVDDVDNCAFETGSGRGTQICERHTKYVRQGVTRNWPNHETAVYLSDGTKDSPDCDPDGGPYIRGECR